MINPKSTAEERLIGYARVSRPDQIIDMQINALLKHGVPSDDIYQEKVSGISKKRPQLQQCLEQLKEGDTLVVWKLDRLGRNLIQLSEFVTNLKTRNIKLVILTETIDLNTAMGSFFFHMMASMAQLERDLIVERTKAGLDAAKARGTFQTRPIAFDQVDYEAAIEYVRINPTAKRREVAEAAGMKIHQVNKHWDKIQNAEPWKWGNNTVKIRQKAKAGL